MNKLIFNQLLKNNEIEVIHKLKVIQHNENQFKKWIDVMNIEQAFVFCSFAVNEKGYEIQACISPDDLIKDLEQILTTLKQGKIIIQL